MKWEINLSEFTPFIILCVIVVTLPANSLGAFPLCTYMQGFSICFVVSEQWGEGAKIVAPTLRRWAQSHGSSSGTCFWKLFSAAETVFCVSVENLWSDPGQLSASQSPLSCPVLCSRGLNWAMHCTGNCNLNYLRPWETQACCSGISSCILTQCFQGDRCWEEKETQPDALLFTSLLLLPCLSISVIHSIPLCLLSAASSQHPMLQTESWKSHLHSPITPSKVLPCSLAGLPVIRRKTHQSYS